MEIDHNLIFEAYTKTQDSHSLNPEAELERLKSQVRKIADKLNYIISGEGPNELTSNVEGCIRELENMT